MCTHLQVLTILQFPSTVKKNCSKVDNIMIRIVGLKPSGSRSSVALYLSLWRPLVMYVNSPSLFVKKSKQATSNNI